MSYHLENVRKAVWGPLAGVGVAELAYALAEIAELEGNVFAPIAGAIAAILTTFYVPNEPATSDDPRGPVGPVDEIQQ